MDWRAVLLHRLGPAPRSDYPLCAPSLRDEDDEDLTCLLESGDTRALKSLSRLGPLAPEGRAGTLPREESELAGSSRGQALR